jgi:hypothetical protein
MPVRYEFSGDILRLSLEGSYTPQDVIDTFLAALSDRAFPKDAKFIMDVRRSSELANRSVEEIKAVARVFARHSKHFDGRGAIVASKPVHYGLARMGATFIEPLGAEIRVFSDVGEAISWLNTENISRTENCTT